MLGVSVGVPLKVQTAQPESRPLGQTGAWIGYHHASNWDFLLLLVSDLLWTNERCKSGGKYDGSTGSPRGYKGPWGCEGPGGSKAQGAAKAWRAHEAVKAQGAVKAREVPRPRRLRRPGGPMRL